MASFRSLRPLFAMLVIALVTVALPVGRPVAAEIEEPASFFIANQGGAEQTDADPAAGTQGGAVTSLFASLPGGQRMLVSPGGMQVSGSMHVRSPLAIAWSLEGGAQAALEPEERLANNALVWDAAALAEPRAGVPTYAAATQYEVYPGVAARYTVDAGVIERVLTVAPRADDSEIGLRYAAADGVSLAGPSEVAIGDVRESIAAFQVIEDSRQPVEVRFVEREFGLFGIEFDGHDERFDVEVVLRMDLTSAGATGKVNATAGTASAARLGDHPLLLERIPDAAPGDYLVFLADSPSVVDAALEQLTTSKGNGDGAPETSAAADAQIDGTAATMGVQGLDQNVVQGGDKSCSDVILADGDIIDPTLAFQRVARFIVPTGVTANVLHGTDSVLQVQAHRFIVNGTLNLNGAGFAGGPSTPASGDSFVAAPGTSGDGPGGGGGAGAGGFFDEAAGGGGAGYGGNGGNGGFGEGGGVIGLGGPTYGMALPPGIEIGSGGGSGASNNDDPSGAGGNGGGGLSVLANLISVNGIVTANGGNGGGSEAGAGGGGSGGGILFDASQNATGSGILRTNAGPGGSSSSFGGGGGGGAGGRIKFAGALDPAATWSLSANGAGGGSSFFGSAGAAGQPGTINSALASAPDPDGPNVSGCSADLSIFKYANPSPVVIAGEELFYHIFVSNHGPTVAGSVIVTDTLPAGVIYLADNDNCVANGQVLTCDLGSMEPFTSQELIIKTRIAPDAVVNAPNGTLVIENVAEVSGGIPDSNPDNNVASVRTFIQDEADLKVTKLVEPHGTIRAGDVFTYTIYVDNFGPSAARNVVISDTLLNSGRVSIQSCAFSVSQGGGTITQFTCTTGPIVSTQFGTDIGTFRTSYLDVLSPTSQGRLRASFRMVALNDIDVNNTVRVTSDTPDPDMSNNMAMSAMSIYASADLAVTKTSAPDPVLAGNQLTYTINVTNNGPSRAENVVVTDNLPAEVDIISVTATGGGSCTAGTPGDPTDPTTCNFNTIFPGTSEQMTIVVRVHPDAVTNAVTDQLQMHNDVLVYSDAFDPDNSNNIAHETTLVQASADLSLQKFAIGVPRAGEVIHYEYAIRNLGPSVARNVTLRDFLPNGVTFLSAVVDMPGAAGLLPLACGITEGSNALFCPLGDIAPTDSVPLLVFVNVLIDADVPHGTVLTNTADVFLTDTPDPNLANNSASRSVTVTTLVNITVRKLGMPQLPVAGTTFKYTISVENAGPSDAFDVEVVDTLPAGFTFLESTDFCQVVPAGSQTIRCRPAGNALTTPPYILPAGQTVTFDVYVHVHASVVGPVPNLATATVGNPLANIVNLGDTVNVQRVADLRIRKFGKPDGEVRAGENLTYTVFVDNLGPSFTSPVYVTDEIVSDGPFYLVGIDPEINGFPIDDTLVFCDYIARDPQTQAILFQGTVRGDGLGALAAPVGPIPGHLTLTCRFEDTLGVFNPTDGSGRWAYRYVLRALDRFDINNLASVSGPDPDPDLSNNQFDTAHEYLAIADLSVTKTDVGNVVEEGCPPVITPMAGMVTAGERITWTITVENAGPSVAENVKILDRLPPFVRVTGYTFLTGTGSCSTGEAGNPFDRLMCGIGDAIPATGTPTAVIEITALVDPSLPEGFILENDVMVMSDVLDLNNANDQTSTLTQVKTAADLAITKSDFPDAVIAGEELRYTIRVVNHGPSDAMFVVVTDTLPAQLTFVSAAATQLSKVPATCSHANGIVTCALGTIPPGHFGEIEIVTTVNDDAVPPGQVQTIISNNAVVGSMTFDPCLDNNTVDEPTTVERISDVYIEKTDDPDPVNAGTELRYTITFGNNGPSTATNVTVTDLLPAGLTFLRCEPQTAGNEVSCTVAGAPNSGQTVTLNEILQGGVVVWNDVFGTPENDLDAGEEYSFDIVVLVDAGYVLDGRGDTGIGEACRGLFLATGYPHYAHDRATITAATIAGPQIDVADECTRVEGLADLAIEKTDIFGDPIANPDNYFLQCDPVEPGGMITYILTITNSGPSDAAQVVVMDWLPARFVAVDPAQVMIEIAGGAGLVEEVRDTGKITLLIGNDDGLLGRLNAGNSVQVTISVMVRQDAPCGGVAVNEAMVTTRALMGPPLITSPTPDSDLNNNTVAETTKIECPAVEVIKTVSYDRTCPGVGFTTTNLIGYGATFCYEIINTGTTYLDEILITDTLRVRSEMWPMLIFTDVIRYAEDPKVPVPPGATVRRQITVPPLNKECGKVTNVVTVTANPVNSGRTDLPCLELVTATDSAVIEVPCAGVDFRLQLPTLGNEDCETWIQVQNVGDRETMAMLVIWGDAGFCPPQAAGPLKVECSGLIRPGSAWSFLDNQIPNGARSAVVYSLATDRVLSPSGGRLPFGRIVCDEFFFSVIGDDFAWAQFDSAYRERLTWRGLDFSSYHGEPIAATVNRNCPDPTDPSIRGNAAYTGISSDMEGARDPFAGGYMFFAPLIFASRGDLNSTICIQNSGTECSSLELWFKAQDDCLRPTLADVLTLAPGETICFDPNMVVGPDWLGSAWIRASQPMGIVVDTMGANHFTSYTGFAADIAEYSFSLGSQVNYLPLIYSEYQGWDTAIQVQNLSAVHAAKVKVYFLDRNGGIITTLVDWVCPFGSQTFFLPVLAGLPGSWVGSARVESQEWWSPGQPLIDPPRIKAVALLERWADPARTMRREAVAYSGQTECLLYDWQLGSGKGGLGSGSAVFAVPMVAKGNRGITSEIAITNLVPKPGFTDVVIYFYDQNGLLDHVCEKLNQKQVEYVNLDTWGWIPQGYLGSMVVSAVFWEHDVFDAQGGFVRNVVGLGGVAVERVGGTLGGEDVPGDESKAFEALPIFDHFAPETAPRCPGL